LPTGSGKTVVYVPIALEAMKNGKRVAIIAPTKASERRIVREIKRFDYKLDIDPIYGYNEYLCPLINNEKAENWLCNEMKENYCKPNNLGCGVIKSDDAYQSDTLLVTNFSKFLLSNPRSNFDLVIIDDSHSFENAREQAYQVTILYASLVKAQQQFGANPRLSSLLSTFSQIFGTIWNRCVPPGKYDGNIADDYVSEMATKIVTPDNDDDVLAEIRGLPTEDQKVFWDIYYFIERCKKRTQYLFFVRRDYYSRNDLSTGQLIARQSGDNEAFMVRRRFGNSRVILATATPGEVTAHAKSCTARAYDGETLEIVPKANYPEIEGWFKNLDILVATNIDTADISKALSVTSSILGATSLKSLILFKNYRDQRLAQAQWRDTLDSNRIYFIDETREQDYVENVVKKKEVVVASASSTIWEGINIEGLRLVVIMSPPFIRPPISTKEDESYPHTRRRMIMRLQQGIGRIIRGPTDYGVAVLMDKKFLQHIRSNSFSSRLRDRVSEIPAEGLLQQLQTSLEGRLRE
jgi:Rad3-related DNA helicase